MIVGITGTNGAGKGVVSKYLVNEKGFSHFSARGFISEVLKERGLDETRQNMIKVGNELRSKYGPSYIIEELSKRAEAKGGDSVIESIRNPGEAKFIHDLKGQVWAVDADQRIRFDRVAKRGTSTDDITFDKFVENEKLEMNSEDPNKQNLSKVIEIADHVLHNNGTVDELYREVDKIIE